VRYCTIAIFLQLPDQFCCVIFRAVSFKQQFIGYVALGTENEACVGVKVGQQLIGAWFVVKDGLASNGVHLILSHTFWDLFNVSEDDDTAVFDFSERLVQIGKEIIPFGPQARL
jgi:hypothetical protein